MTDTEKLREQFEAWAAPHPHAPLGQPQKISARGAQGVNA